MILEVGETLISTEVFTQQFVCHLDVCKGACCVEGDRGAPLENEEIEIIENNLSEIKQNMTAEGLALLNQIGFHEGSEINDASTTCLPTGECVFAYRENGILGCAIEKTYKEGKISYYKPISCHLYPIRLNKIGEHIGINYHSWDICKSACANGAALKVSVFEFLKEPLIRKFGVKWYNETEQIYNAYLNSK